MSVESAQRRRSAKALDRLLDAVLPLDDDVPAPG
jgi:hypothetical protein